VQQVASAPADGHTLVMPITSFPINPSLQTLPFDTVAEPPRSALSRVLAAVYLAASVRLRSVFSTTTTSPP
jgi:hypothetical protein